MLKIYNTLTRKTEEFKPLKDKQVGMYVCGPTVYGPDHIGHIKTWIFFDWLKRYLLYKGYKVKLVQNITDVGHLVGDEETGEDKIEKQAEKEQKKPEEIARYWEEEHLKDLKSLNFLAPDLMPRATDHIEDIVNFIETLILKGYAYEVKGNVYFNVSKDPNYGKLSGRKAENRETGTRVEIDRDKKDQADFALWLKAENHLQKWPSPWGEGYPGWHIECSVMSAKYLGQPFDIHGSGVEHIFPHHENEIAQSESFAGVPLSNYWLHTGMLTINGTKMSKSKGNYITVKDALKEYDADTLRIFLMTALWKKPIDWNKKALLEARKLKERLVRAKMEAQLVKTGFPTKLEMTLDDDFNLPKALAVILEDVGKLSRKDFEVIEEIFGLSLEEEIKLTQKQKELIKLREKAREKGDYKESDRIRKILEKEGFVVEDTLTGSRILPKA
ncbi:MAG: cysteine--tRNA ligase [Patescibacteria group bacterium]